MKIIIKDNQRAFLYKHGVFVRMAAPGKHRVHTAFGWTAEMVRAEGELAVSDASLAVLRRNADVAKALAVIDVPDKHLALHFVDGRIAQALKPGQYAYWNLFVQNTFELVDVSVPESAAEIPAAYMKHMPTSTYTRIDIAAGEIGLLYYNGVYQRTLEAGQFYYWTYDTKVTVQTVDTRAQQLDISGQEILTADKVSLRINFVCTYQVTDAVNIVSQRKEYQTQLYVLAQLALRELASKYRFDDLLRQKDSLGGLVLEKLREREAGYFVAFSDAGVKDIILPGEIRDIMNTVLVAEKAAQASVIARREETAATRSLMDTAKLMDENTTLFKLKELEYLERICDKVGNISVDAGGGILQSLRELMRTNKP